MENEFENLYNESIKNDKKLEKIVTGKIIKITEKGEIFVDLKYKADGIIPKKEYSDDEEKNPSDEFKIGDEITAEVLRLNDGIGNVLLSYKKIKSKQEKDEFDKKVKDNIVFEGIIKQINEKGIVTEVYSTRVFIPMSLSGIKKGENLDEYKGKKITFEITEYDPRNKKIIGSHKAITDKIKQKEENEFWESIVVDKEYKGKVVSINNYGVFVDLNGAHGLLHISEITWKRNADANKYFKVGQEIIVSIKSLDKENKRIQLAYKEKELSPWENISDKYKVGDIIKGKVTKFMQFGVFVEIEEGIEGLVHISNISDERIIKPEQVLELDQIVDVKIIEMDAKNKRIGLSIKEVHSEDWKEDILKIEGVTFESKD